MGEIALVVIGILIALQINNWNSARMDRLQEKKVVKAIQREAQDNLAFLHLMMESYLNPKKEALKSLLDLDEASKVNDSKEIADLLAKALSSPVLMPKFVLSERILNSPEFDLIQSDSLKMTLLELHNLIEITKVAYTPVENQTFWESLTKNDILNRDVIKFLGPMATFDEVDEIAFSKVDYNYHDILANEEVESILSTYFFFTVIVARRIEQQTRMNKLLLDLIGRYYPEIE